MKQRLAFLLILTFGLWAVCASAQDTSPDASVYNVTGVTVDVTSDSAAKARDQAITDAQRAGFTQLLDRLGAESSAGDKLSANDLATLVQNFEVQNEHVSPVRYIGTFTVQFRPLAVRAYLNSRKATYNDSQGQPVLILPVMKNGAIVSLWDEQSAHWQKLWNDAARAGGIVPILVPAGTPEDKNLLTAADAVAGKTDAIKPLIDKYQVSGAVVATLNGSFDNPAAGFTIDLQHFGGGYDDASDVAHITVTGTTDKSAIDAALMQNINKIRVGIEKDARKSPAPPALASPPAQTWSDEEPPARLPVTVQFNTLAEWADIQRRLLATPGIRRVDVISVGRGVTEIELGFAGKPEDIQLALAQHNMRLTQDVLSGQWMLRGF